MDKFYLEVPTLERKDQAIEYIKEHIKYKSNINGSGGLHRYVNDYEGWLQKLDNDSKREITEEKVPALTYFLIRVSDNKIIGMINIRLALNENLNKYGGNIGYGIRPTERSKGYNKINLYLGLLVCSYHDIGEVLLDADENNIASWKTMESLGGILINTYYDEENNGYCRQYKINVRDSINKYKDIYKDYIYEEVQR